MWSPPVSLPTARSFAAVDLALQASGPTECRSGRGPATQWGDADGPRGYRYAREAAERAASATPSVTADLSDAGLLNEVDYLPRAAVGLVLEEEMANAPEQHELGARNLPSKARRVVAREVLVPLPPEDQRGHPKSRE